MKYVVYYNESVYGRGLKSKMGKDFKKNVEDVLGTPNIIWIVSDRTDIYPLSA